MYYSQQIVPDQDILDLAKARQLSMFSDCLKPMLPLWYGLALRITNSEVNASRLLQYGILQIWQQPDSFRPDFGAIWWQVVSRMQERSKFLGANLETDYQPSGLPMKLPADRILYNLIIEGKTLSDASAQLNVLPSLAAERLGIALVELYSFANEEILNEADLFTLKAINNRLLQIEFAEDQWVDIAAIQQLMPKAMIAFECYVSKFAQVLPAEIEIAFSETLRNVQLPANTDYGIKVEPLDPTLAVTTKTKLISYQVGVALMGIGVVILGFLLIQTYLRLSKQGEELSLQQKEKEILYQNFLRTQKRNEETDQTMSLIQREKAAVYYLKSTSYAPESDIIVFWSKKSGRVFTYLNTLQPPAKNNVYKIWAIQKISSGIPVFKSLALLPSNTKDHTLVSAGIAQNADGFVVSEETDPSTKNITSERIVAQFPVAY